MANLLTKHVSFDFIRYANCWEDADILLQGLNPLPNQKILSIGSAGDNSFSLLINDPQLVVAVDVNKIQLYLIELKKACITHLSYQDILAFLGFTPSNLRVQTFQELKPYLSKEVSEYWSKHIDQISAGIISQGKFERYFEFFSKKILPWIHSKKTVEELFRSKTPKEQVQFYTNQWNTWRWRFLFKIFFSKYVLGKYGRDPEFLKEVQVPVGAFIFEKAALHLQSVYAQTNFILHYNLCGNFGNHLPHYLQKDHFIKIKQNISKLSIYEGFAEDACKKFGSFDRMNLSNIFEYMNKDVFKSTAEKLIQGLDKNGKMAYWNLMVPRRVSDIFNEKTIYQEELSIHLSSVDKGFFYKQFIVDQVC